MLIKTNKTKEIDSFERLIRDHSERRNNDKETYGFKVVGHEISDGRSIFESEDPSNRLRQEKYQKKYRRGI